MTQLDERRRFTRFPPNIPIEIEIELGKNVLIDKDFLNDISLEGLSFKFTFSIDQGKTININIPLDKSKFRIKAEVKWCEATDGLFNIGVKFLDSTDSFKAKIYKQLRQIEAYKFEVFERDGRELTFNEAAKEWIDKYAKKFS